MLRREIHLNPLPLLRKIPNPKNFHLEVHVLPLAKRLNKSEEQHRRGVYSMQHQMPMTAVGHYDNAIRLVGEERAPWSVFDKGKALIEQQEYKRAVTTLTRAAQLLPTETWPETELGRAYLQMHHVVAAEQHYHKALELLPGNDQATVGLQRASEMRNRAEELHVSGVRLHNENKPKQALEAYNQAIAHVGPEAASWSVFDKGKVYISMGKYGKATKELLKAKAFMPNEIWVDLELAEVYLLRRKFNEAQHYFDAALGKDATNETARQGTTRINEAKNRRRRSH